MENQTAETKYTPNRFDYVKYDEQAQRQQEIFKDLVMVLERKIWSLLQPGRARNFAITKLEETYMWIGKAIRDEQVTRNGPAPLQEERTNS